MSRCKQLAVEQMQEDYPAVPRRMSGVGVVGPGRKAEELGHGFLTGFGI